MCISKQSCTNKLSIEQFEYIVRRSCDKPIKLTSNVNKHNFDLLDLRIEIIIVKVIHVKVSTMTGSS